MPTAFVSTVINAPIERVWRTVGDFNGLPAWMPGMASSVIEDGKGDKDIGAVRRISMSGSKEVLREQLRAFSPDEHLITYAVLEGPLPVKNVVTSMRLRPITDTYGTLGEWSRSSRPSAARKRKVCNSSPGSSAPGSAPSRGTSAFEHVCERAPS
jgi:uncharacterized protein YndB with AHSA1/START domain